MISETIKKQIIIAMKGKDEVRLRVLKMLASELYNKKIDCKKDLTKEEEMIIIKAQAKMRRDAIDALRQAQGKLTSSNKESLEEKLEEEEKELEILKEFLPKEMGDEELEKIVVNAIKETSASNISGMGKVMGAVMGKTKGSADGNRVSAMVRAKLSS